MSGAIPRLLGGGRTGSAAVAGARRERGALQEALGKLALAGGMGAAGLAWVIARPEPVTLGRGVLLLCLVAAVAASARLRLRIGSKTYLYVANIPLYLLATLFAPPVAMVATGVGIATRELSICRRCQNSVGQVSGQIGRWMLLTGGVAALFGAFSPEYVLFAGMLAGVLLWLGDLVTAALILLPPDGRSPGARILALVQQSYAAELMQYLIGLFALGLFDTSGGWLDMLYVPLIVLSSVLLYIYLKTIDEMNQAAASIATPAKE